MQYTQKCIIHHLSSAHILIPETIFLGHIPRCKCHCVGTSHVYSIRTLGVIKLEVCCSGGGVWGGRAFTWTRWRVHVVMLLVPLHGTVVTQHHLPQCFAEVRQAGDVTVQGDVLPTEKGRKWRHLHSSRQSHVRRRTEGEGTLRDSWITKVHKKSLTKINQPRCRILVIKASLRNHSRTPALKIFCFSPRYP